MGVEHIVIMECSEERWCEVGQDDDRRIWGGAARLRSGCWWRVWLVMEVVFGTEASSGGVFPSICLGPPSIQGPPIYIVL
ncbi:hypothetical protein DCAR_0728507 [Daucus carota subsp. sativus]|uniref:Uncharacterized protein n=1 Tax=Daucus carota subsp. sativus TaxID=79200 RepID=A0A164TME9_DAUCS|nr:hypothetical protein DCAR_0728507 [Daucus carota subsp. sativus]